MTWAGLGRMTAVGLIAAAAAARARDEVPFGAAPDAVTLAVDGGLLARP